MSEEQYVNKMAIGEPFNVYPSKIEAIANEQGIIATEIFFSDEDVEMD